MTYQLVRLCARASLTIGLAALAAHHLHTGDRVSAAAPGRAPIACDALAALVLPDTIITLTESVPAYHKVRIKGTELDIAPSRRLQRRAEARAEV